MASAAAVDSGAIVGLREVVDSRWCVAVAVCMIDVWAAAVVVVELY